MKTFSSVTKKVKSSHPPKQTKLKTDRKLFGRLLITAKKRPVDFKSLLCNPSGLPPLALSNPDNTLCKMDKVLVLHKIEETAGGNTIYVQLSEKLQNSALVLDGMAEIHQLRLPLPPTFGELASLLLANNIAKAKRYSCGRVDFVVDKYLASSIKATERQKRSSQGISSITIYGPQQKTPRQWKKSLRGSNNKTELLKFCFGHWATETESNIKIFTAFDEQCLQLISGNKLTEDSLKCDHEEADTRLLLHAKHVSEEYDNIIVCSPYIDVAVIAISLFGKLKENTGLYFFTGTDKKKRMLNIEKKYSTLGPEV